MKQELSLVNDQVHIWRRSYDISPPGGESLKDTHDESYPFFKDLKSLQKISLSQRMVIHLERL